MPFAVSQNTLVKQNHVKADAGNLQTINPPDIIVLKHMHFTPDFTRPRSRIPRIDASVQGRGRGFFSEVKDEAKARILTSRPSSRTTTLLISNPTLWFIYGQKIDATR